MARVGMIYSVFAPITAETAGSAITYGSGVQFTKSISATITDNRRDTKLFADDITAERDAGLTDYNVDLEGDDITPEMRVTVLGWTAVGSGDNVSYEVNDSTPPYGGYGYVRKLLINNIVKYQAIWCRKIQFTAGSEEDSTKGESINFGTTKITGNGVGVYVDNTGVPKFREYSGYLSTEAAAKAFINTRANIT